MNAPTLFDFDQHDPVETAGRNADPEWVTTAHRVIQELADRGEHFTADDVWELLDARQVTPTHEPRALGAVLRAAKSSGLIRPTAAYLPSRRPECHGRPVRVWQPQEVRR